MQHQPRSANLIGRAVSAVYRWRGIQTATDPVCGMAVDPKTAKRSAEYDGRTYYFCAPGCRKTFLADPRRVLSPDYVPTM